MYPTHYKFHLCIQPSDVADPDPLKENLDYVTETLLANGHDAKAYEVARYMVGVREKKITSPLYVCLEFLADDYTSLFWVTNMLHKLQKHRASHSMTFDLVLVINNDFDILLSNPDFYIACDCPKHPLI